jgi:drug/metabolite transporter (DMT)-like permease
MKLPLEQHDPVAPSARGIAYFLVASVLFIALDTVAKLLTDELNAVMAVWGRYVFHLVFASLIFATGRFGRIGWTAQPGLQIVRSLLLTGATLSFFIMLSHMPLADSVALSYVAPIILTVLGALILREKVGPRRWAAVILGFVGAMIIIQPGFGTFHWAAPLGLVCAFCFALYAIATRVLSGQDSPATTIFYTALVGALVMSAVVPFFWISPSPGAWGMLVALGFLGAVSHFMFIKALDHAPASGLAPYGYIELVWAALFGLVVFGDVPGRWTIIGGAVVVGSGLYIFYRERVVARA